jgi:hypothetical protein
MHAADIGGAALGCETDAPGGPNIPRREGKSEVGADGFPIIVAEWPRNARELVRITLGRFNNRFTIDMRSWWQDSAGIFKPSRSGLTLDIKHLPRLAEGLDRSLTRAEQLCLVGHVPRIKDRTAAERQRRYRQRRNGMTS